MVKKEAGINGYRDKEKFSIHDTRTLAMMNFLKFLDKPLYSPKPDI